MKQSPVAVVLAGGEGKRFKPFVTDKTLFPFLGKPFLSHCLQMLQRAGITEVVMATNTDNQRWLDSVSLGGLTISTKLQKKPVGMGDAMLLLEEEIGDRPFIVINPNDCVADELLHAVLAKSLTADGVVVGVETDSYFPGGYLQVDGTRVMSVVEKPGEGNEPSKLVKPVFDYFAHPSVFFTALKKVQTDKDDHYEKAQDEYMKLKRVEFIPYSGYWKALKYNYNVLDVMHILLYKSVKRHIASTAVISDKAVIHGEVYIDEGAHIYEGAVLKGPVYVGKNAIIGNNALVRESMIEEGAVIGFGSEVTRSYIGPKCMLHHNFMGDSVLERDVNPSFGTVTANLRLDNTPVSVKQETGKLMTPRLKLGALIGQGAFLGINCSIMPGVTIGAHAVIYPATVVHSAVPANATLVQKQQQEIIAK